MTPDIFKNLEMLHFRNLVGKLNYVYSKFLIFLVHHITSR